MNNPRDGLAWRIAVEADEKPRHFKNGPPTISMPTGMPLTRITGICKGRVRGKHPADYNRSVGLCRRQLELNPGRSLRGSRPVGKPGRNSITGPPLFSLTLRATHRSASPTDLAPLYNQLRESAESPTYPVGLPWSQVRSSGCRLLAERQSERTTSLRVNSMKNAGVLTLVPDRARRGWGAQALSTANTPGQNTR